MEQILWYIRPASNDEAGRLVFSASPSKCLLMDNTLQSRTSWQPMLAVETFPQVTTKYVHQPRRPHLGPRVGFAGLVYKPTFFQLT